MVLSEEIMRAVSYFYIQLFTQDLWRYQSEMSYLFLTNTQYTKIYACNFLIIEINNIFCKPCLNGWYLFPDICDIKFIPFGAEFGK